MKIPEKLVPLLVGVLILVVFFLGRLQAQNELLKKGVSSQGSVKGESPVQGQPGTGQGTTQEVKLDVEGQGGTEGKFLTDEQLKKVLAAPAATKGQDGAPVTIVEFTDYQCPFCSRHFIETMPQIEKDYISSGKVRYLLRDYPLPFHGNATAAAMAARCAGDQGKYWEMHDVLFEKQDEWADAVDGGDTFSGYAKTLGLNSPTFSSCLSQKNHKVAIDADYALAQELGVSGTPGFFINGKLVVGALPYSS